MNNITYQELLYNESDIIELYRDNEWTNYTENQGLLFAGIKKSLFSYGAYDGPTLVGLIRVVGDDNTIIYIQDILVLKRYQNKGIGSILLKEIIDRYKNVRQIVLTTDNSNNQKSFYEKNGFKEHKDMKLVAFILDK